MGTTVSTLFHTLCAVYSTGTAPMATAPNGARAGAGAGASAAAGAGVGTGAGSVLGNFCSRLGALFTPRRIHPLMATVPVVDAVPLLVRVLAGNPATGANILACLNTADARYLRRLHPAVAGVVAGVPWCDTDTPVVDAVRWRAGLPAAVGARLAPSARLDWVPSKPAAAALGGITHLDTRGCAYVTDAVLLRLPTSLRILNVRDCNELTAAASLAHLTALTSLDCSGTRAVNDGMASLPPSLQELDINHAIELRAGVSLARLRQLRVLRAEWSELCTSMLATLPPSFEELHAACCKELTPAASFAHLTALRKLDVARSAFGDGSLATMPPSLVCLNARECRNLTPAAELPHLPALRLLDVSSTLIGEALVASLPASLIELRLAGCFRAIAGDSLDHLSALRQLHCIGTDLAPAALAACRRRGCAVPAASELRGHFTTVPFLTLLSDGRLASGDINREVRLWNISAGGEAAAVLRASNTVLTLAALRGGRYLAIGTSASPGEDGYIEAWDVSGVRPARRATTNCCSSVWALAVLPDGRLAAGCSDGKVRVVDVDAGAVVATLTGHTGGLKALAVLPGGRLASGSRDTNVRVWDVAALACEAMLTGHTDTVWSLAVLSDGRLATGSWDSTVRLWDVGARACVGVLTGLTGSVRALAALPDGRLVTGSEDHTIRLWDTRPAAAAGASRAVGTVPVEIVSVLGRSNVMSLLLLPDGRLACGGGDGFLCLLELPPPAAYE